MKAIFLQYYRKDISVIGLQVYNDFGNPVLFQTNEFFGDEVILNTLIITENKLDVLFYLVTDKFLSGNKNFKEILNNYNDNKKGILLSHSKIREKFEIHVNPTSEIFPYLNILSEKILHQNCKSETELVDRIKLVERLVYSYNFYSLIYPQDTIKPELKKFIEHINNFEFNNEKIEALSLFLDFLQIKDHAIYILIGSAGTGKTTLVRYFLELYKYLHQTDNYLLMAPTGKAARVLEQKTKLICHTIHKSIYSYKYSTEKVIHNDKLSNPKENNKDIQLNLFTDYELSHNEDYNIITNQHLLECKQSYTFVVVDESSMVTDYRSELELEESHQRSRKFGRVYHNCTGFHLNDIIRYLQQSNKYVKLILVGDSYQLPPIQDKHDKFIPALDLNFLQNKYSDFKIFHYQLNQSFRFANDEIYMMSVFLRSHIESAFRKGKAKINFSYNFNKLINEFKLEHPEIQFNEYRHLNLMLQDVKKDIQNETSNIIITHTNVASNYINCEIRRFLGKKYLIECNDKLICTKNNYVSLVMNGEQFAVTSFNRVYFREVIHLGAGISYVLPFFDVNVRYDYDDSKKNNNNILIAFDLEELYQPLDINFKNKNLRLDNYKKVEYLIDKEFKSRIKYRFFIHVKKLIKILLSSNYLEGDEFSLVSKEKLLSVLKKWDIISANNNEKVIIKYTEDIDKKIKIDEVVNELKHEFSSYVISNLSDDKFLNSIICKYGYAITCHKSQGSEWKKVYVTDLNKMDLCWLYTAITRASQEVSFLNVKIDTSQNNYFSKSFFRLLRSFEGEILNVRDIRVLNNKELLDFMTSSYMPSYLPVKPETMPDVFNPNNKFILVITSNCYYYFLSEMLDSKELEKIKDINTRNLKISFIKGQNERHSKARIIKDL